MKKFVSCFVIGPLLFCSASFAAEPTIQPPAEPVAVGQSVAMPIGGLTTAQCDSAAVKTTCPDAKAVYQHGPLGGEWLYFRSAVPGIHTVIVQVPQPGLDIIAMVSIQVGKGGPLPPDPPIPPVPGELNVVIVHESKSTPKWKSLVLTKLKAYLVAEKIPHQIADKDRLGGVSEETPKWLAPYLAAVQGKLPAIVIGSVSSDGVHSVVVVEPLPQTPDAAIAIVEKYGGK